MEHNISSPTVLSTAALWPRLYPLLGVFGGLTMAVCQWLIFVYAPVESTMGIVQKIFYLHMPLAWWGLFSFFIVFLTSIVFLIKRTAFWDVLAHSAAYIGLTMAVLALVTGSIWAKYAWGVWWTWDARLTTTLIMCFVYAGYLVLRRVDMPEGKRSMVAAVIGIVAFLDVPLVFFSARLWSHIHPPSIGLDPDMKTVVIACVLALGVLWTALVSLCCHVGLLEKKAKQLAARHMLHLW